MQLWPEDWPKYHNASIDACDIGPCICGAWHQPDEFKMEEFILFRYGKEVGNN